MDIEGSQDPCKWATFWHLQHSLVAIVIKER